MTPKSQHITETSMIRLHAGAIALLTTEVLIMKVCSECRIRSEVSSSANLVTESAQSMTLHQMDILFITGEEWALTEGTERVWLDDTLCTLSLWSI